MRNSKSIEKTPYGAISAGSDFTVSVLVEGIEEAVLHVRYDTSETESFPMSADTDGRLSASCRCEKTGLYFYAVEFPGIGFASYGDTIDSRVHWFQQTVYDGMYSAPKGFAGGIMYQIFPDRFNASPEPDEKAFPERVFHKDKSDLPSYLPDADGKQRNNDFFGGTFRGIEEKLDYLASLNVSIIYLNPIFKSCSNHRYDTFDYLQPDPLLGTEEDFTSLCHSAAERGMRVILDGVFSHTGADSIYFDELDRFGNGALHHPKTSPYTSWFNRRGDSFHYWWGFTNLPEVNEMDPSFSEFITGEGGVIDHWIGLGASGFRLDVADELPDEFIEKIYRAVKRHGDDTLLIGEVWEDASNKVSYGRRRKYLYGHELDGVMNYPARTAIIEFMRNGDGDLFMDRIAHLAENYPFSMMSNCMNSISTHDTARALTSLVLDDPGDREIQARTMLGHSDYLLAVEMFKLATAIQFAIPGIPCIYYGDEIGMQGFRDPFNRGYFRWDSPDRNVLSAVRKITEKHAELRDVLEFGTFNPVDSGSGYIAFTRRSEDSEVLFAVNTSDTAIHVIYKKADFVLQPWSYFFERIG